MDFKVISDSDKEAVKAYVDKLPQGKRFDISIKLHREKRTIDQNRLLFLWIGCVSHETGYFKDEVHEIFKKKFLGTETFEIWGEKVERIKSTTSLDTKQFSQYLERIQQFAATEMGIILPDPKDQYFDQFYQQYKDFI